MEGAIKFLIILAMFGGLRLLPVLDLLFRVSVSSGFVPGYLKTNRAFVTKHKKKKLDTFRRQSEHSENNNILYL